MKYENKTLHLSKIFSWYQNEFATDGNLLNYINRYRENPVPAGTIIQFNEYDWSLNDEKQ